MHFQRAEVGQTSATDMFFTFYSSVKSSRQVFVEFYVPMVNCGSGIHPLPVCEVRYLTYCYGFKYYRKQSSEI